MHFVNMKTLCDDVYSWEKQLLEFDAVCGISRSGLLPASMIAMLRNIRMVDLDQLIQNPDTAVANAPLRSNNPLLRKPVGNRVLIVDDSSSYHGVTVTDLREKLANRKDTFFGAVYGSPGSNKLDFCYKEIPHPRMFEWNFKRNFLLGQCLLDMDGVICKDYVNRRPETDRDPEFYEHLKNVQPLYLPGHKVLGIVTSRLERYREETEDWLKRHGVSYGYLKMNPSSSPEERRMLCNHAEHKAKAYKDEPKAIAFIESSFSQAKAIFQLTFKPVICTDTMTLI